MLEVRPLLSQQWELLRSVRLQALADAPEAFSATLAEAQSWSDEEWQQRATRYATSDRENTWVAFWDETPCGMIGCYLLSSLPETSGIAAVWVNPRFRRQGVGEALIDATLRWSAEQGVTTVQAWVTEHNDRAIAFYERVGFQRTEQRQPYAPDPEKCEILLVRTG